MPLEITLNPPQICLTPSTSSRNIVPESPDFIFGSVYKINAYTYNCRVGDKLMFNKTLATLVTLHEGTVFPSYFIIDEADFKFKENPIP